MREIKFRGKAVNGSGWILGMPNYQMTHIFNDSQVDSVDNYEVIPETIGQFTGLKDKNGVEIYEGDIFCREFREIKYSIVFENGSFYCYHTKQKDIFNNPYRWGLLSRAFEADIARWGEVEVIGNIHDNPELLTKN